MMRLGIVGCGGIASAHGRAAQALTDARFVACCDVRRQAAVEWASQYSPQAAVYTDYFAMLREQGLDGVLLATWPNQHHEQISLCLKAGVKNILCEKALALTGREAAEIWQMAGSAGAFVMEGFMYRHNPAIRRMEELISRGEVGQVDNVRAEFGWDNGPLEPSPVPPLEQRNWRLRRDQGGGVPYDATCYAVNACGHFAGSLPTRAYATGTVSRSLDIIVRLFGVVDYANGVTGLINSSHGQQFSQELQIEGTRGHLYLPVAWTIQNETAIEERHMTGWAQVLTRRHAAAKADSYELQLRNFVTVAQGQARPVVPLAQSVVNTCVIEALVTSLLERRPVDVEHRAEVVADFQRALKETA